MKIEPPLLRPTPPAPILKCALWPMKQPRPSFQSPILTHLWVFPWYPICPVRSLADFWSPLKCDSVDHISHAPRRPTVQTAYFLMRARTQSVCSMKSTICFSGPISCAVHSFTLLLTRNRGGLVSLFVGTARAAGSDSGTLSTAKCSYSPRNVIFVISGMWKMVIGEIKCRFCFCVSKAIILGSVSAPVSFERRPWICF